MNLFQGWVRSRLDRTAGTPQRAVNPNAADNTGIFRMALQGRIPILILLVLCLAVPVQAAAIAGNTVIADYDTCHSLAESKTASANATLATECQVLLAAWQTEAAPAPAVQQLSTETRALLTSGVDDSKTVALLHFNGADGSTVFTDETGKTWSASGNAHIDPSQSRFGGASLALDGSGDYIYTGDSADWDLGQNFTVDFWVRFNQILPEYTVMVGSNAMDSRYYKPGWTVMHDEFNDIGLRLGYHDGAAWRIHSWNPWDPSLNTWYHVAITRDANGTIRHFINGQQVHSQVNTYPLTSGSQNLFIGGIDGYSASSLNAYVDEVRISKGIARWTANFTPPNHEYGPAVTPVANFTATPTSGTAPLTVQFNDTSENWPTSWLWDFGDGDSTNSTLQDPVHTYAAAGTYTVSLTAANSAGSDKEEKTGYVEVTQTAFTVYSEGVSDYHGGQPPLGSAVPLARTFYQNIVGANSGGISWTGYGEFYNDDAGSKHWSVSETFPIKADNADFAIFAGHGANDRIYFGTSNSILELPRTDMQFGGSKLKWLTLSSCNILHEPTQTNWNSVFNGLHILNSYDTEGLLYDRQGGIYAAYLTGGFFEGEYFEVQTIRNAWRLTLEDTIGSSEYFGASSWAEPCGNDFLPGYGPFCSAPSASIGYKKFDCDPETSD